MFTSSLLVSLLSLLFCLCIAQNSTTFQVGAILDLDSLVGRMAQTSLSLAISDFYSVNSNYTTRLQLQIRDANEQVVNAAASALDLLKNAEVDAIIGPQKSSQASFVIGLGAKANVPMISFSATSPSLQPQSAYFVQAALGDSAQAGTVSAVIEYYKWTQVVIVSEDTDYGNGIIPSLTNELQAVNARISHRSVIHVSATDDYLLKELYEMKTLQTRVFVVHMSSSLASRFFPKVKEVGMMSEGYAWIVTTGVMDLFHSLDPYVIESMEGVIGVKPLIRKSERLTSVDKRWTRQFLHDNPDFSRVEFNLYAMWAYDATWAVAMAAERVGFRDPSSQQISSISNSTNPFTTQVSKAGPKFQQAMSDVTFDGLAGKFHLVNGQQLEPSTFQILNVVGNSEREVGMWTPSEGILMKKLRRVMFPGDPTDKPKGWGIPVSSKKLKIAVPLKAGFPEFVQVKIDPETNATKISGCFIDMFDAVMAALPYAMPYDYVPIQKLSDPTAENYDEFPHQVSLQAYDGAVGDISITYKRSKHVEFTLPFTQGGINMVMKKTTGDRWFFLKPLSDELWLSSIALFMFTGLAIWILEHRFNSAYRGSLAEHAGMIFYFPFMSLVYAQRERIVSNFSRLVMVVWVFVVMILASTYTASLSAKLTVEGLQPGILRKGDYVGCRKGSFIYSFLIEQGFHESRIRTYVNPDDMDEALMKGSEKGGISALFSVKPYTDLFLAKYNCDKYSIVGPTFPTEGYAFVFGKDSPIVVDVSRAIIQLTENGRLSEIAEQLMRHQNCDGLNSMVSYSIPLRSFQMLFATTGAITATCVIVSLAKYAYESRGFITRIANSDTTTWSKVRAIFKHFDERDPRSFRSKHRDIEDVESTGPSPSSSIENPSSSTVVPVSEHEIDSATVEESSGDREEQAAPTGKTRPTCHQENVHVDT